VELVKMSCVPWQGAYAPLTLCGELLVDGAVDEFFLGDNGRTSHLKSG